MTRKRFSSLITAAALAIAAAAHGPASAQPRLASIASGLAASAEATVDLTSGGYRKARSGARARQPRSFRVGRRKATNGGQGIVIHNTLRALQVRRKCLDALFPPKGCLK